MNMINQIKKILYYDDIKEFLTDSGYNFSFFDNATDKINLGYIGEQV